ncbi:MAG: prepilin-type N-terminal cleavage/methylation domain-containing protein [Nitrospinota bacterium]|nr:prepilin-type N-terminal cleavage/methylation domain-containing protein [Nitrospinota bacterium]
MENRSLRAQWKGEKGFTLIEILISITIFSLIFTFILNVLTTSISASQSAEKTMDVDHVGRFIIKRITADLVSATTLPQSKSGGFIGKAQMYNGKSMDEMHFTSHTRLYYMARPQIDISEIGYYFLPDVNEQGENIMVLMRRESDVVEERIDMGGVSFQISNSIKELKIRYLGKSDRKLWLEHWDSENNGQQKGKLPKAVSVELTLADGKRDFFYSTVVKLQDYEGA